MWNWFNCYLSGRHEFGVWCEPGAIFLRCAHCGKRSHGWELPKRRPLPSARPHAPAAPPSVGRVVPFERTAAR